MLHFYIRLVDFNTCHILSPLNYSKTTSIDHAAIFLSRAVRKRPDRGIGLRRFEKSRNLIFYEGIDPDLVSNLAFFFFFLPFSARGNAYPPPCAPVGNKDGEAREYQLKDGRATIINMCHGVMYSSRYAQYTRPRIHAHNTRMPSVYYIAP